MLIKKSTIKKSIVIYVPREKVWNILLNDKFSRIWYAEFGEGSHAETDWKVGSKALFKDNTGNGLVSKVIVNKPNEMLSVEYEGLLIEGVEDYDSDYAEPVRGGRETYYLSERAGVTLLSIECDMADAFFESMSLAWDNALQKIKELAATA